MKKFILRWREKGGYAVKSETVIVDDQDAYLLRSSLWIVQRLNPNDPDKQRKVVLRSGGRGAKDHLSHVITGCPNDWEVVHKNGNGLDNRRENLLAMPYKESRAECCKRASATQKILLKAEAV